MLTIQLSMKFSVNFTEIPDFDSLNLLLTYYAVGSSSLLHSIEYDCEFIDKICTAKSIFLKFSK